MDCEQLKSDVQELQEAQKALEAVYEKAISADGGKHECEAMLAQVAKMEDGILEANLKELVAHNRELFIGSIEGEVKEFGEGTADLIEFRVRHKDGSGIATASFGGKDFLLSYSLRPDGEYQVKRTDISEVIQGIDLSDFDLGYCFELPNGDIAISGSFDDDKSANARFRTFLVRRQEDGTFVRVDDAEVPCGHSGEQLMMTSDDGLADKESLLAIGVGEVFYDDDDGHEEYTPYLVDYSNYKATGRPEVYQLEGFVNDAGDPMLPFKLIKLSEDRYMIAGGGGSLIDVVYVYKRNEDGTFEQVERIKPEGNREYFMGVHVMPNGDILMDDDRLHEYRRQSDGSYELFDTDEKWTHLEDAINLANGDILIATGGDHELSIYSRRPDGSYVLQKNAIDIKDVFKLVALSSGNILICTEAGEIYEYILKPDGNYEISEMIARINFSPNHTFVEEVTGDEVLIHSSVGKAYRYSAKIDLERVKEKLGAIADKAID